MTLKEFLYEKLKDDNYYYLCKIMEQLGYDSMESIQDISVLLDKNTSLKRFYYVGLDLERKNKKDNFITYKEHKILHEYIPEIDRQNHLLKEVLRLATIWHNLYNEIKEQHSIEVSQDSQNKSNENSINDDAGIKEHNKERSTSPKTIYTKTFYEYYEKTVPNTPDLRTAYEVTMKHFYPLLENTSYDSFKKCYAKKHYGKKKK